MAFLKGLLSIFMVLIVLSFGITMWDLFLTDPCQSYNRATSVECEQ